MKPIRIRLAFSVLIALSFSLSSFAQVQINTNVTTVEIVQHFGGPGIMDYSNMTFQGADVAKALFSGAGNTLLGMESGVVLCTGNSNDIPGPNSSGETGTNNGTFGNPSFNGISSGQTYDAAVLEFDFIPMNDTLRFNYIFGSEEYNEHVESYYNDLCAAFLSGPDPNGGYYSDKNIMLIPGTYTIVSINTVNNGYAPVGVVPTGPCSNCQYYDDNTGGIDLEYDGFTTQLTAWLLVVPMENYHIKTGVADVAVSNRDSGLFLEENSLFSPGPGEFTSYDFLTQDNPGLSYDVIGWIENQTVNLGVYEGTDVTSLVARYVDKGAYVSIDGQSQVSGVTPNDFTNPVIYQLKGHDIKDWTINVSIIYGINEVNFNSVLITPNPSTGDITIKNCDEIAITLTDPLGRPANRIKTFGNNGELHVYDLPAGVWFIHLEKDGLSQTRKVIVY